MRIATFLVFSLLAATAGVQVQCIVAPEWLSALAGIADHVSSIDETASLVDSQK